jgi:hypothetical protein
LLSCISWTIARQGIWKAGILLPVPLPLLLPLPLLFYLTKTFLSHSGTVSPVTGTAAGTGKVKMTTSVTVVWKPLSTRDLS